MTCLSMVSLLVLVNEVPTQQFNTRRGLRQRYPLSPFLFKMVIEALCILLHGVVLLNLFNIIKVENDEVSISHLQYANNTIIFCEPAVDQLLNVKKCCDVFKLCLILKSIFKKAVYLELT